MNSQSGRVRSANLKVSIAAPPRTVRSARQAILPESRDETRCTLKVDSGLNDSALVLVFESRDMASLRAGLNTDLRLISAALTTLAAISGAPEKGG